MKRIKAAEVGLNQPYVLEQLPFASLLKKQNETTESRPLFQG
jgi:hypothetical protein